MEIYKHKVQYYETDRMGFVHHSNYIRWFEEARTDFFDKVGAPYTLTESLGLISPVLTVQCEYKKSCYFGETVLIYVTLEKVENVRFYVSYRVTSVDGELRATGTSSHCFLNEEGKVTSLKKVQPELYKKLEDALGK